MGIATHAGWRGSLARSTTALAFGLTVVLVFSLPWRGAIQIGPIGTIGRVIGAAAGAVWAVSALVRFDVRMPSWFHVALGALACWSAISALWTISLGETVETTVRFVLIWAILVAIWDLYRSPEDVDYALQAYVLGAFVVVGVVFYNFALDALVRTGRFSAFGLNPNIVARTLVLGAPLAWYLCLRSRAPVLATLPVRAVNLLYLVCAGVAIALTGARQGMVGFAITLAFVVTTAAHDALRGRPAVGRMTIAAGIAVLAGGVATAGYLIVAVTDVFARVLRIPGEVLSGSFGGRGWIWEASVEVMAQRPLLGHGSGTFVPAVDPLFAAGNAPIAAHNVILELGVELGAVGIAIYAAILLGTAVAIATQSTRYRTLWATVFAIVLMLIAIESILANVVKFLLFMFAVSTATMATEDGRDVLTVRQWCRSLRERYAP